MNQNLRFDSADRVATAEEVAVAVASMSASTPSNVSEVYDFECDIDLAVEASDSLPSINLDADVERSACAGRRSGVQPLPVADADIVVASSAFAASESSEMSLAKGDIVLVTKRSDEAGWWHVSDVATRSHSGWVPMTHCRPALPDELARARSALAELARRRRRKKRTADANSTSPAAPAPAAAAGSAPAAPAVAPPASAPSPASSPSRPLSNSGRTSREKMLGTLKRAMSRKSEKCDDVPVSEPTFVEHRAHIGVTEEGTLETRNIDDTWKSLFISVKKVGRARKRRSTDLIRLGDALAPTSAAPATPAEPPAVVFPDMAQLRLAETLAEAKRLRELLSLNVATLDDDDDDDDDADDGE